MSDVHLVFSLVGKIIWHSKVIKNLQPVIFLPPTEFMSFYSLGKVMYIREDLRQRSFLYHSIVN